MKLEVIDSLPRLLEIESEWASFAETIDQVTPFQIPRWLLTWWSHFGSGKLHTLIFRDGGGMAGVIPCFLHMWEGRRQLTLIGSGISDYLDPTVDPRYYVEILSGLHRHLQNYNGWDICVWQDLTRDTFLRRLPTNENIRVSLVDETTCTELSLKETFEEFWKSRPKDLRRNVRRYGERARSLGILRFEPTDQADLILLDALISLHACRWRKKHQSGMIEANQSAGFLRDVVQEFGRLGLLQFFTLYFKEEIAAIILGFRYRNRIFSYLSAFDPKYEILGFGRLLLYESLQYAYERGYSAWNFLRGDEPYKRSWGAEKISKARLIITREM